MKMVFMFWRSGSLVIALLLATLPGCGLLRDANAITSPSRSGILTIVTAAYPFEYVISMVTGIHGQILDLTAPGAEPHDLELTPRQVATIGSADLVVYEKGFQAAVDQAVKQSANRSVVDLATVVARQPLDNKGTPDPHVWLDPTNLARIAKALAARLSSLDPANAPTYEQNASELAKQLSRLDSDYRNGLKTCQRRTFVTTHAAFGYLAKRYGLQQISISGLSPDAEPSPSRIAQVQRLVREQHITTLFYEPLASPAQAESIAGDLGLTTDVLDPIEGLTSGSRAQDYQGLMRANLGSLRKAGNCS